jgi:aspartyl-tRNA synthetase
MSDGFPSLQPNAYRDTWCGQVLADRVGTEARVAGWVHRRRDHGGLIFIDLRDRTGLVQLVFNPDLAGGAHELAHGLRAEDVILAQGEVVRRSEETINRELSTGEFEIRASHAEVLADAATPPFGVESYGGEVGEEARLRYRYLDLRREPMRDAIALRHRVTAAIRDFLDREGFYEIETPVLTRSTPEGARDFLVPSRLQPGNFYALPQSPQLFKQLLMVAGFERYYQIARCFRDEDQRADRQLDFTQLDIEMSFVTVEEVLALNEELLAEVLGEMGLEVAIPFPRLGYDEAIARYGSDRPDLRFGLEIADLTDALGETEFNAFRNVIEEGGTVRGINAGSRELPRAELDGLIEEAKGLGAKGLVWAYREGDGWRSPVAKFLSAEELSRLNERLKAAEGDLLLIVADTPAAAAATLGGLRSRLAARWDLIPADANELTWIVDWPLMEWDEEESRWDPLHHPFTSPAGDFDPSRPGEARALAYDLVWNGVELGGGSIRINRPDVQRSVFEALGIGPDEAEERFGFLLEAFRYGAPPHGGIAYGLDRLVAQLHGAETIRDVIAFPKMASGADPLTGAPAPVGERQLRELGLSLRAPRRPGG